MELLAYLKTETINDWPGIRHPSLLCVIGASGSGKTVFASKFVQYMRQMFRNENLEFHKIIICSAVNQPIYAEMFQNAKRQYKDIECVYYETLQLAELKSENFLGPPDRNCLLLIDDLLLTFIANESMKDWLMDLINIRVHHSNTFLIMIVPDLFYSNDPLFKALRKSAHYFALIRNGIQGQGLRLLQMDILSYQPQSLTRIFQESNKFSRYLFINRRTSRNSNRFVSGIFPNEQGIIYRIEGVTDDNGDEETSDDDEAKEGDDSGNESNNTAAAVN